MVFDIRVGQFSGHIWQCLCFCPLDPCTWQSLLFDHTHTSDQLLVRGWLSHSISSSRVATMARAFWWASLTLAKHLSTEASLPTLLGVLLLGGWASVDWDLTAISGVFSCFCSRWSLQEDTASSINSGSPGGDPSSLCCLYTSRYKDWISSLLVWGPISWTADTSASGSNFGNSCWWPWQTVHSAYFCPWSAACWNISYSITRWWGLSASHLVCPSRNSSISITLSVSQTDKPSLAACPLAARALSLLLPYFCTNNL